MEKDILIIGGGPAGSTTALYLSKLGYDITLIEKKKFPRETLCGEFLSKEVTDTLKELNIFQEFISLKPNQLKSFRAVNDSGTELHSALNFDAYAMKRSVFDLLLLNNAEKQNVNIIQPANVKSVSKINTGFVSEIENEAGESTKIKSRLVIAAYGKQNPLDKELERSFIHKKSFLNGVKFHLPVELLKEKFSDEIRIYIDEGIYCGMNQVNDSEITVCFLENRKNSKIPSRERLAEVIRSNKSFRNIFTDEAVDHINSANVYGTGNIHFGKREVVENGIIMVGDSARVIAPLAGDGIGMAMESAKILYQVLLNYKLVEYELPQIYLDYKRQYEKSFSRRLAAARIIQAIILNKKFRKMGFTLAYIYPPILPYLIKFTRNSKSA
ncbi:MAG TPA: NAD(P)/FAD-dependent oxidoreductase [Ignavibacteriaceae bacterium]|nr:NAD(P)/FAD-dependent oxidoreductase [Ignavibacteriaceae bacterium]